jgi:hypothetical protein
MDFVTGLPESNSCFNLMVVTGHMSKDAIFVALPNIGTETVYQILVQARPFQC